MYPHLDTAARCPPTALEPLKHRRHMTPSPAAREPVVVRVDRRPRDLTGVGVVVLTWFRNARVTEMIQRRHRLLYLSDVPLPHEETTNERERLAFMGASLLDEAVDKNPRPTGEAVDVGAYEEVRVVGNRAVSQPAAVIRRLAGSRP